jgi:hypothetical protein
MTCPRCSATLTPAEVLSLMGKLRASMRKTRAGGRPKGKKDAQPRTRRKKTDAAVADRRNATEEMLPNKSPFGTE